MADSLEVGKLYLWDKMTSRWDKENNPPSLVLVISFEKIKPIYTKYNLFVLENATSQRAIVDKFGYDEFIKQFTEVTDEAQIEAARKKAKKK